MIQSELCQQGSRHIGLIHDFINYHRLLDGSPQPQHRNVMNACGMSIAFFRIVEPMVGQTNDKQVVPQRRFLHPLYELSEAIIGKGESIRYLFV